MKTLKLRIYTKHSNKLNRLASAVNFVWNYVNDLGFKYLQRKGKFLSAYDCHEYTKGAGDELGLHSQTLQAIAETHSKNRKQFKKRKLKWRSNNPKSRCKSLGWIPFKRPAIKHVRTHQVGKGRNARHKTVLQFSCGKGNPPLLITVFDQYDLSLYKINTCELVQDSLGRWYACITVKDFPKFKCGTGLVGLDLGCKTAVTTSGGDKLETKFTHKYAQKLTKAQRAGKKKLTRTIHAKIKNSRLDAIHKFTTNLVKHNAFIALGKLNSSNFTSTNLAKSVYDASWFKLKRQLEYKCKNAGCLLEEVDEKYTTQRCSCCGEITVNSPKGRKSLGIREWTCSHCGTTHDRDVNGAKNILRLGCQTLVAGSPLL